MELDVKIVAGIESCFVSLPLPLIEAFQNTRSGSLPSFLALELHSRANDELWHVAWSGSASSSSSIEIAQQYAECICLPDHTTVQVRAVANLPKATLVTIEPLTEDDWEVLELNAELAEALILKQVGIVHEAMRFPLWLHGRTIITFLVVSTFPKNPVVQLVPGTEVAVAPKRRKINGSSSEDSAIQSSSNEHTSAKALLRVQESDDRFFHCCEVNGVELGMVLTYVIFVHPETAKFCSLDSGAVVVVPRFHSKDTFRNHQTGNKSTNDGSSAKQANGGILSGKQDHRQAIVYLLISESVARGHVMPSETLRLYLGASVHSWLYVNRCNINVKKNVPLLSLSPCRLGTSRKARAIDNDVEVIQSQKNRMTDENRPKTNTDSNVGSLDWSMHERVITALSKGLRNQADEEIVSKSIGKKVSCSLLHAWYSAHLHAINSSNSGAEVGSLILGNQSLIHIVNKCYRNGLKGKAQPPGKNSFGVKDMSGDSWMDILYVLSAPDEPQHDSKLYAYDLAFDEGSIGCNDLVVSEKFLAKLNLDDPVYIHSVKDKTANNFSGSRISSLGWMGTAASDVLNRLVGLLSPDSGKLFSNYNLPFPGHVLIHGPPGSGKTLLASAVAQSVQEHEAILAHIVFMRCFKLALDKPTAIRQALSRCVSEAIAHAPSVVILDDVDTIISSSTDLEGSQPSSSVTELTQFLTGIIDEYEERRRNSCGIGPIAFIACAQSLTSLPQALSSSGRFDFHVQLSAPAASERGALLKHEIHKRSLQCSDDILLDVASKCDGYDAYDLEILVDRAVHAGISRFLSHGLSFRQRKKPDLTKDDFMQAMEGFLPVSMRDITKSASEGEHAGWEDVGGLPDIRSSIKEMIELPSKFPNVFGQAPLRLRSNVLLYGPPGCGKTHIVGAAAVACSLRFISVKGPELLNKYIGASEQAVRDIFSKAAAAAPCLLFFDEFDSIAPKRGHDNTGVTDRVVNQFLTELDGVEVLTGVFVFAATSRPDLLDAALLRPGRLDRLLFCDFPSKHERLDILNVLSRKLPLASDVDLDSVAGITEGFSGADLQALLSDAQLAAVHELLDNNTPSSENMGKKPIITGSLLNSVASKARPSVSDSEKKRLYGIYSQFLDAKRSVNAQSRDAKGKRATLA